MRTTATSVGGSLPSTRAAKRRLSASRTITSSAPATTWLLVRTIPDLSTMNPEPSPSCFSRVPRGSPMPNWSRSMRLHGSSIAKRRMNFVLWMVTTAPLTRSTSGATVPGSAPVPTAPGGGAACTAAAAATTLPAINDDTARRIIGRQRDGHLVAENHANPVLAQLAAEMSQNLMAVFQLDAKISGGQHLDHAALELYVLLTTHRRREPYALRCRRSTMSTPVEPSANAEITDDLAGALAPAKAASTIATRYIEDPRELIVGHAVQLL